MFAGIRAFYNQHKRKILIGSVVISSVVFLTRYTQRKIREWQENEIKNLLNRTKRRQYFESTEKACNQMIQSVAVNLREAVTTTLDTESIVNKLRSGCTDKVASWNELKVRALSRSAVVIYSHVMLVTLIKIQFNLIGGYMYKDSQSSETAVKENGIIQTRYMSLCSYFICEGIQKLCTLVQEKVEEITVSISLKNELTLRDLEQIYWAIMSSISADNTRDPTKNLAHYMLPPNCEETDGPILSKLVNETLDLLESKEVQDLVQSNIRSGFMLLVDHISEYFINSSTTKSKLNLQNGISVPGTSNRSDTLWRDTAEAHLDHASTTDFTSINKITMPMAKIIPIINGQVPHKPMPRDVPSDWLRRLILNDELRTLGANVYEAFSF